MRTSLLSPCPATLAVALAVTLAVTLAACNSDRQPPVGLCTAVYTPAVSVSVIDSSTGRPLADSAVGVATTGNYADSLHKVYDPPTLLAGGAVSGSYAVRIERPGYSPWSRSGIPVTPSGVCAELKTVSFTAKLQAMP